MLADATDAEVLDALVVLEMSKYGLPATQQPLLDWARQVVVRRYGAAAERRNTEDVNG